jgi:hypothetical protein
MNNVPRETELFYNHHFRIQNRVQVTTRRENIILFAFEGFVVGTVGKYSQ